MKKPSIKEISDYCRSRGNGIDPELFFDHYESVGWMRGKAAMKSWQATIRTWERNEKNNAKKKKPCREEWAGSHVSLMQQHDLMEYASIKNLQPRPGESWEEFSLRVWRTR